MTLLRGVGRHLLGSKRVCPDRFGERGVVMKTGDYVPMQMWRHVAKAGDVHFVGI